MDLLKKNEAFIKWLVLIAFTILFAVGVMKFSVLAGIVRKIITVFQPIIYGFCFAFIINLFLRPLENLWDRIWKKRKISFKIKRAVCLTLSIILVAGVVFAVLFLIIPELVQTFYVFLNLLPEYLDRMEEWFIEFEQRFQTFSVFNIRFLEVDVEAIKEHITELLPKANIDFVNKTLDITAYIFSGFVSFVLSFFFAVYMLVQKEALCRKLKKLLFALLPVSKVQKILYWTDMINRTFTKFATGQVVEAVILGILCFAGMLVLRIPYEMLISVLISFTALLPVFGAFIGIIAGAFLILTVHPGKAVLFVIFAVILQQIEGNLIYPKVVGKSVGLPGILVLAAVTVGGNAFGILGLLMSVPIVSIIYIMLQHFVERRLEKRKITL